jgi:hypothetical protein
MDGENDSQRHDPVSKGRFRCFNASGALLSALNVRKPISIHVKTFLLIALSMVAGVVSHAQGTVNFNTRVVEDNIFARAFDLDGETPLTGPEFRAQLWGGPSVGAMAPLTDPVMFQDPPFDGYISAGTVVIPAVPPGGEAWLQVRAWYFTTGETWESASARGESNVITITAGTPPLPAPNLIGLRPFIIPEPSTIVLAVLGAFALLLRRCREGHR